MSTLLVFYNLYRNCKIKLRKEFINNTCIWIRKIPIRVPTDVFCPKSDRMGWIRIWCPKSSDIQINPRISVLKKFLNFYVFKYYQNYRSGSKSEKPWFFRFIMDIKRDIGGYTVNILIKPRACIFHIPLIGWGASIMDGCLLGYLR